MYIIGFILITLSLNSFSGGREEGATHIVTLRMKKTLKDHEIDRVGSKVFNKETAEEIFPHCIKRDESGKCLQINYILRNNNLNYIVQHGLTNDCNTVLDLKKLEKKKSYRKWKKAIRYEVFHRDEKGKINLENDFYTKTIGSFILMGAIFYGGAEGALYAAVGLITLPYGLVVDTLSIPVMTFNSLSSIKYVKSNKDLIFEDEETRVMNNKQFNIFMDTLYQTTK